MPLALNVIIPFSDFSIMPFSYTYPRPAVTVDIVVFAFDGQGLRILLIQRGQAPFEGQWALPGGFVHIDETLEGAALRELREETGLQDIFLEQLYTFGELDRDPRERTVSVAYVALVALPSRAPQAATDARDASWFDCSALPSVAFDHAQIIQVGLNRLRSKIRYQPIGFELLPRKFTLGQLQQLYEAVLGGQLDKRNFRKKEQ